MSGRASDSKVLGKVKLDTGMSVTGHKFVTSKRQKVVKIGPRHVFGRVFGPEFNQNKRTLISAKNIIKTVEVRQILLGIVGKCDEAGFGEWEHVTSQ